MASEAGCNSAECRFAVGLMQLDILMIVGPVALFAICEFRYRHRGAMVVKKVGKLDNGTLAAAALHGDELIDPAITYLYK